MLRQSLVVFTGSSRAIVWLDLDLYSYQTRLKLATAWPAWELWPLMKIYSVSVMGGRGGKIGEK